MDPPKGDVYLLLQNDLKPRKPGRPKEWANGAQFVIYTHVEELMARGVNKRRACLTVAWWYGLSLGVTEARHKQGQAEWESLPEQDRILRTDTARHGVDSKLRKFGILLKGAKLPSAERRRLGIMRPDEILRFAHARRARQRANKIVASQ
jgi:hypothetical protein